LELWVFDSPATTFHEFLKTEMIAASISRKLISVMFSSEKYKAFDLLSVDFLNNPEGLFCNLDLILKWMSLVLYEKEDSTIKKGIDYLILVFQHIANDRRFLSEIEGEYFIPHIIKKFQKSTKEVLLRVHQLLNIWQYVYPYSKIVGFLMESFKSNNLANQSECIKAVTKMIEMCDPNFEEIVSQRSIKIISNYIISLGGSNEATKFNFIRKSLEGFGKRLSEIIGNPQFDKLKATIERFDSPPLEHPLISMR
jgi:hypothetical protein